MFRKRKEYQKRVKRGLELLDEKEAREAQEDAIKRAHEIYLHQYIGIAKTHPAELMALKKKLEEVEFKVDTDFDSLYTFLVAANNWLLTEMGNTPLEWPNLTKLPFALFGYEDAEKIPRLTSVRKISSDLKNYLESNPNDINKTEYDIYSIQPEIVFLVKIKELFNDLVKVTELILK